MVCTTPAVSDVSEVGVKGGVGVMREKKSYASFNVHKEDKSNVYFFK